MTGTHKHIVHTCSKGMQAANIELCIIVYIIAHQIWVSELKYLVSLISKEIAFPILKVLSGIIFICFKSVSKTVETLIRCPVLQHLILVCTVCLCPTKRTLGLYGLTARQIQLRYNRLCDIAAAV